MYILLRAIAAKERETYCRNREEKIRDRLRCEFSKALKNFVVIAISSYTHMTRVLIMNVIITWQLVFK